MQQKAGVRQTHSHSDPMSSLDRPVRLRSVLKRAGQKSKGFRVSINESKNKIVESDYIILIQDEEEPQLVSIKALDLSALAAGSQGVDILTLSPPDGYKDCFGRAVQEPINGDLDNESEEALSRSWKYHEHGLDCPKSKIQELLSPGQMQSQLSFENFYNQGLDSVEHHHIGKTGILKGGKFWKSADPKKTFQHRIELDRMVEPRRSVRFSGQDQFNMVEPHLVNMSHAENFASFLSPQFHDLEVLLSEKPEDWQFELSPIEHNQSDLSSVNQDTRTVYHLCPKHGNSHEDHHEDDEHISESIQRYEEMRRRIAMSEMRDNSSVSSDESKTFNESVADPSTAESRIRRLENSDVAQVAGGILRSNNEVRRAIERNALRRSLIRFAEARKKDTNRNDKNGKQESSLIDKLKWLTASEDVTNGNAQKRKQEYKESEEAAEDEETCANPESKLMVQTMEQYRKLAEMFNKSTSSKVESSNQESREWRIEDGLPCEPEAIAEFGEDLSLTLTYTAVPAVCEPTNEEENDKLIYSGGVRYTKEGTLPIGMRPFVNEMLKGPRSIGPEGYPPENEEEVHDDRASSIPSSSQSSPRLPVRNDSEAASTTESGYSSNETNSEISQTQITETDELIDFVRQDTGRIQRIRRKYDDTDDHGFARRPSVRGIKNRFGTTSEIIKQMTQLGQVQQYQKPQLTHQCSIEHETARKDPTIRNGLTDDELSFSSSRGSYTSNNSEQPSAENSHQVRPTKEMNSYGNSTDIRTPCSQRLMITKESSTSRNQRLPPLYPSSQGNTNATLESPTKDIEHQPSCHTRRQISDPMTLSNDMLMSGSQHPSLLVHNNRSTLRQLPHQGSCSISSEGHRSSQEDNTLELSMNFPEVSYNSQNSYHDEHQYDHHMNIPSGVVSPCGGPCSHHPIQISPMQHNPPVMMIPEDGRQPKKLSTNHQCDKPACSGWHSLDSRYTKSGMTVTKSLSSTIVSSHMSYTTPMVPENCHSHQGVITNGGIDSQISSKYMVQDFHQSEPSMSMRTSHSMNIST